MAMINELHEEAFEQVAAEAQLADPIRDALGGIADELKDKVVDLVKTEAKKLLDATLEKGKANFWAEGGWYAKHREDVILKLPIRSIHEYDLRKVFELVFGPKP